LEGASTGKPESAAGAARKRRWSWAMEPNGSGTWPNSISPARCRSSISITRAHTCGIGAPAASQRPREAESVEEGPPAPPARQGENRIAGRRPSFPRFHHPRSRRENSHRGRLLREKRRADALSQAPPPALICRLGGDRSWVQDRGRSPAQTIGDVLDGAGS